MSVEAIAAVGTQLATATPAVAQPPLLTPPADTGALASMTDLLGSMQAQPGDSLFERLVDSLGEIDSGMKRSREATTEIALGQTDHLHQVLIDAERTRLQFDLAMSMRNRVLEAYQEIMRMQV